MRTTLGNKQIEEYVVPGVQTIVRCFRSETLFIFGIDSKNTKYRWCLGVGRVCKIIKGDSFDLVYINFGRKYAKEIIVQYNHARRQLLTLKIGQLATFYGKFKIYKNEQGETRSIYYAIGLQAWYVPKAMDIKKMQLEQNENEPLERVKQEDEDNMNKLIEELLGSKK